MPEYLDIPRTEITFDADNNTYTAVYWVERGEMMVEWRGLTDKADVGNLPVEPLAKMLLGVLARKNKDRQ